LPSICGHVSSRSIFREHSILRVSTPSHDNHTIPGWSPKVILWRQPTLRSYTENFQPLENFRFQVSGFRRFSGSGFRFQVSGLEKPVQVSGFRFQVFQNRFRRSLDTSAFSCGIRRSAYARNGIHRAHVIGQKFVADFPCE